MATDCTFVDVTEHDTSDLRGVLSAPRYQKSFSQRAHRILQEAMFARGDAVWLDYLRCNPRAQGMAEIDLIGAAEELETTALTLRRIASEMARSR